jgi:hypothetical protein
MGVVALGQTKLYDSDVLEHIINSPTQMSYMETNRQYLIRDSHK